MSGWSSVMALWLAYDEAWREVGKNVTGYRLLTVRAENGAVVKVKAFGVLSLGGTDYGDLAGVVNLCRDGVDISSGDNNVSPITGVMPSGLAVPATYKPAVSGAPSSPPILALAVIIGKEAGMVEYVFPESMEPMLHGAGNETNVYRCASIIISTPSSGTTNYGKFRGYVILES